MDGRWGTTVAKPRVPKVRLRPRVPADAKTAPAATAPLQKLAKPKRPGGSGPRPSDPEFWTVINEITDPVPIAPAELDAIESYFSAVLDAVFDIARKTSS
jgi:hypothetical protein